MELHTVNVNDQTPTATSRTIPVNYATLEADVAEYIADLLERTRNTFGETDEEEDARIALEMELYRQAPWAALLAYVEDNAPREQLDLVNLSDEAYREKYGNRAPVQVEADKLGASQPIEIVQTCELTSDGDFNPIYRDVEIDGEMVEAGNVDAIIQMALVSDTPEARTLIQTYTKALADLKEANAGASGSFLGEEAFTLALGCQHYSRLLA